MKTCANCSRKGCYTPAGYCDSWARDSDFIVIGLLTIVALSTLAVYVMYF